LNRSADATPTELKDLASIRFPQDRFGDKNNASNGKNSGCDRDDRCLVFEPSRLHTALPSE
jgi:hypothetical protein